MDIILDTNIIRQHFWLDTLQCQAIAEYLRQTQCRLVLPEVVVMEATELYRRELQKSYSQFNAASRSLNRLTLETNVISPTIDIEDLTNKYNQFLKAPKGFSDVLILPNRPEYLSPLLERVFKGRKPAAQNKREYRDTLIWMSIVDYMESSVGIIFITENTSDFFNTEESDLHPELKMEVSKIESLTETRLVCYSSVESFLQRHAYQLSFVTNDWLQTRIPVQLQHQFLQQALPTFQKDILKKLRLREADRPIDFHFETTSTKLDSFFVSEISESESEYFLHVVYLFNVVLTLQIGELMQLNFLETYDAHESRQNIIFQVDGWYSLQGLLTNKETIEALEYLDGEPTAIRQATDFLKKRLEK